MAFRRSGVRFPRLHQAISNTYARRANLTSHPKISRGFNGASLKPGHRGTIQDSSCYVPRWPYRPTAMTDPTHLRTAVRDEIADALSLALPYDGRKRVYPADEMMARITANLLARHLETSGHRGDEASRSRGATSHSRSRGCTVGSHKAALRVSLLPFHARSIVGSGTRFLSMTASLRRRVR
jgi:hypothetical protein